jgi:hypothetical protein
VGLRFIDGQFVKTLPPGRHAFWNNLAQVKLVQEGLGETVVDSAGQEIMMADKVTLPQAGRGEPDVDAAGRVGGARKIASTGKLNIIVLGVMGLADRVVNLLWSFPMLGGPEQPGPPGVPCG